MLYYNQSELLKLKYIIDFMPMERSLTEFVRRRAELAQRINEILPDCLAKSSVYDLQEIYSLMNIAKNKGLEQEGRNKHI